FNMMDIQAALGIHQLPRLDAWIDRRDELWDRYDDLLEGLPVETPPSPEDDMRHARHLYQVLVAPDAGISRDELLDRLTASGIGTGVHYRAVHLHPYYRKRLEIGPDSLPVATDISNRTLSLPLSPGVTEEDQSDVAEAVGQALATRQVTRRSQPTAGR
ncbi:MAG: DegT/DnrJ/EryC1/StrS family aminotransferase, partial [Acidimicrobiales bacterium]